MEDGQRIHVELVEAQRLADRSAGIGPRLVGAGDHHVVTGIPQQQLNWVVNLDFNRHGTDEFAKISQALYGTQKLFGWFGGHGREGTAGFFESIGLASSAKPRGSRASTSLFFSRGPSPRTSG